VSILINIIYLHILGDRAFSGV